MKVFKKLLPYFESVKTTFFLGILCLLITTIANLVVPWILKEFITILEQEGVSVARLNLIIIVFLLTYFIKGVFYYGQAYLLAYAGQTVVLRIREKMYTHLQSLSLAYHQRVGVGELISRNTSDIQMVENSIVIALPGLIAQPLTVIGSLIMILTIHWKLALFTIAVVPLIAFAISKFGNRVRSTTKKIQTGVAEVTSIIQENFSALRIIKAFSKEDWETERVISVLGRNFRASIKNVQIMATSVPVIELLASLGGVAFFWYGGLEVIRGNLTTAQLVGFIAYMGIIIKPISLISNDYNQMQKATAALERVFEVLEVQEFITEKTNALQLPFVQGKVEFTNVSMSYPGTEVEVLKDVSLEANPGEVIAFVGESGAGKSTLVNLIPRFYDPSKGQITIDSYDLRDLTIKSLRNQIAIVPQDTILFKGTIRYNIAYVKPEATEEEVIEAARLANAHQFITEFELGYDTIVGERGESLSGGQRQRIAIARAILADPKILILDEATSALDTASELLVQKALDYVMANRTTFVIAHRLSTIINADKIVVLDKGRIVEIGNHAELIARRGYYYQLYQAQQKSGEK